MKSSFNPNIVLLSDCHLVSSNVNPVGRLDDAQEAGLKKIEYILDWASKNRCDILQAGDFLDSSRSWILHSKLLSLFNKYDNVKIFTVFGQHDLYMRSEEYKAATSLGALIESDYLTVLDEKPYLYLLGARIYGCSYGKEIPKPIDGSRKNILVIHKEILDEPLFKGMSYTDCYEFLKRQKDYSLILCGDIHQKFFGKNDKGPITRYILNTGPLLRLEATKYNFQHQPCFAALDIENWKIKWFDIPCSLAEDVLSRKHLENKVNSSNAFDQFIKKVKGTEFFGVDFMKNLDVYFKNNKIDEKVKQEIYAQRDKEAK